jgi:hypothetical protein
MNNKEPERFLNENFDEDVRESESSGKVELKVNDRPPPVTFNGYDAYGMALYF